MSRELSPNTGLIGRIIRTVTNALRRQNARQKTVNELSTMDSRTLADLGLTNQTISSDVTRRRNVRHQDAADFGSTIREFDGPGAPMHPMLGRKAANDRNPDVARDEYTERFLRNPANANQRASRRRAASA